MRFNKPAALAVLLISVGAFAGKHVGGYVKANGTYVPPHQRSTPDGARINNYSTRGNVNPYSGKSGTKPLLKPTTYRKASNR